MRVTRWIACSTCCATALLVLVTLVGCSDSDTEYIKPRAEQTKGSEHPALREKIAAPAVDPRVSNPHAGGARTALPAGHPPTGGGTRPGTRGIASGGRPVPGAWADGGEFEVGGIVAKSSPGWNRVVTKNSMRAAQFVLPHAENDTHDGEMWVSQAFGGDWKSNLSRWQGAFAELPEPHVDESDVAGLRVRVVSLEGTYRYNKGNMRQPDVESRAGYAMIVASVDQGIFFRFVGPKSTVAKWRASFLDMINTIRRAK